jgi:hypothetical protein
VLHIDSTDDCLSGWSVLDINNENSTYIRGNDYFCVRECHHWQFQCFMEIRLKLQALKTDMCGSKWLSCGCKNFLQQCNAVLLRIWINSVFNLQEYRADLSILRFNEYDVLANCGNIAVQGLDGIGLIECI